MTDEESNEEKIFEYIITIQPHQDLQDRIIRIRKDFNDEFSCDNLLSPPHILLLRFRQKISMEDRILRRIRVVAMGWHPFRIDLLNFGCIPCHTIYLEISTMSGIHEFVKHLRSETQNLLRHEEEKPHFILESRINIAAHLAPWQFEKGWLRYSNNNFCASFIADKITVLRRKTGEKKYFPVHQYPLMNLAAIAQGNLFI